MRKRAARVWIFGLLACLCLLSGCMRGGAQNGLQAEPGVQAVENTVTVSVAAGTDIGDAIAQIDMDIPSYLGNPFVLLNGNQPGFTSEELAAAADPQPYASYSELDELGRCGRAVALLGAEMMPAEPRDNIGDLKPTGWHTVKYNDLIADNYLYNRCHLIGYQLGGENADLRNLMTGTRYLNVEGMLPFENRVAQYLEQTGNHVLYRVTPIFAGENLLADGVILEAESVEDDGAGICFCVFAYNVQPQILIDYATGESKPDGTAGAWMAGAEQTEIGTTEATAQEIIYILNKSSGKFHKPACESVSEMAEWNRQESHLSREELIEAGFTPCKLCNP